MNNAYSKNFAFALAIKGSEQQLKDLASKMVEMGYKQNASIYVEGESLITNWQTKGHYKIGFGCSTQGRNTISFDTHSEECIMALLSARKDGEFQKGELSIRDGIASMNITNGKIYKILGCAEGNGAIRLINDAGEIDAYNDKYFTRPTFDQIVAHFAQKEHIVTMTVNADEWKSVNDKLAQVIKYNDEIIAHSAELDGKVKQLTSEKTSLFYLIDNLRSDILDREKSNKELYIRVQGLEQNNAHLAELVHQLKPEPIEPEWIPFDADKWSGKVEDIRDFEHEILLYAKIDDGEITIVYSTNAPARHTVEYAKDILTIRNPNYINPPIGC